MDKNMTIEEAINELEWDRQFETSDKKKEAYAMAIAALEYCRIRKIDICNVKEVLLGCN